MPANPKWARWVFASVGTYLKEVASDNEIPAIIDGFDDRNQAFMDATDRVEIRINGPYVQEISRGYFRVHVDANVLVTSRYDGDKKNGYEFTNICGLFQEAMSMVIPVFRYGEEPVDDTLLGCLNPRPGKNDSVRALHFWQFEKTDRIKQSLVDARYVMYLDE